MDDMIRTCVVGVLGLAGLLAGGVATAANAGQANLPAPTRTAPIAGAATTTQVVTLVGVRHGLHDRYDRVVFDFAGAGTPEYRVEYAPLLGIATGTPIPLEGPADLRIVFAGANAPKLPAYAASPRYPTLRQIRLGGAFEGRVIAGLGLGDRVGFRVLRLTNPPRIAVDVAHRASASCS